MAKKNLPGHSRQEVECEEVIADVAGVEGQASVGVSSLSSFGGNFGVLNDLISAVHSAHYSHGFGR